MKKQKWITNLRILYKQSKCSYMHVLATKY